MQELEKILEEVNRLIEKHKNNAYELVAKEPLTQCYTETDIEQTKVHELAVVRDIIRKHMNDGWIPVDERLPEDEIPVPKLVTALVPDRKARWDNSETFSVIVDTDIYDPDYTGKWEYYKKNVIAWCPLPEPYRPEGSDCDGK